MATNYAVAPGEFLQEWIEEEGKGITQSDLAERSGVTLASIRRFEKEGEISLKNLMLIAIALNRAQDVEQVFRLNEDIDLFKPEPRKRQRARK